jgi:hypothetical protein
MSIRPKQIVNEVRHVLACASKGKGQTPCFLSVFQILDRLPRPLRDQIIKETTRGGKSTKKSLAATSVVARAAEYIPNVGRGYMDTGGLSVIVAGKELTLGYTICRLYALLGSTTQGSVEPTREGELTQSNPSFRLGQ